MKYFVVFFVLVSTAVAQSPVYGQCGGTGWTGATTCASGSVCTYSNPYYSQCLPGSVPPPTTTVKTTTTAAPTTTATSSSASGTVYLAGDSTMASGGGGTGTDGWGQYLAQYLTIPVINDAVAGRSARSYTFEGRFTTIINAVKAGDFVVIEFGHNDGTSNPDNGRSDAVGDDYTTTATVTAADGTTTLVHTYGYYVENAVNSLKAKGATAIVSSSTPDNIWPLTLDGGSRFQGYAKDAAKNVSAPYVDHFAYVAQAYIALGEDTVNTYYPIDHTHTSPTGANVVAEAFVRGLICGGSVLSQRVNAAGKAAPNGCISS